MKPRIRLKGVQGGSVGTAAPGSLAPVASSSFWGYLREPFAGAWQKNITPDQPQNLLAFGAVYGSVTLICDDVAKLRIKLVEQASSGIWTEVTARDRNSPFLPILRKPNRYQTRMQFIQQWLASKLLHGNTYVFKDRDARGVVTALYVLNPFYVQPLIASDGSVFYRINKEWLAGVRDHATVPASEIIHDRCATLWHPLVGVSPIYASGASATMGIRIQSNSEHFFRNMSRPSGHLTSEEEISDETAHRLKREFENEFAQGKLGRLLVTGGGLKYEPMTMSAADAELVKQLDWTVKDVALAFKIPMYKLGGQLPAGATVLQLNQEYYSQTLHIHIVGIELGLREGLDLPANYAVMVDIDELLRMDPLTRSETAKNFITCAVWSPNEGRFKENLGPVTGGNTPYLQQQNYSLEALARRDALAPAPSMDPSLAMLGALLTPRASPQPNPEFDNRLKALETSYSSLATGIADAFKSLETLMKAKNQNQKRSLYVRRDLTNGAELQAWAKGQGFDTTVPPAKMHVTIAYSKEPVDWEAVGTASASLDATGGVRMVEPLGDGGAVVLMFDSEALTDRWRELCNAGCSWDYDSYHPHVSVSWEAPAELDLSKVVPFQGTLKFGPERFEEVKEDWADSVEENGIVIDAEEFHRVFEHSLLGAPQ